MAVIRAGEQPPVQARAGRRALALTLAVIRSFETGSRVHTGPDVTPGPEGAPSAG